MKNIIIEQEKNSGVEIGLKKRREIGGKRFKSDKDRVKGPKINWKTKLIIRSEGKT